MAAAVAAVAHAAVAPMLPVPLIRAIATPEATAAAKLANATVKNVTWEESATIRTPNSHVGCKCDLDLDLDGWMEVWNYMHVVARGPRGPRLLILWVKSIADRCRC